MWVLKCAPRTTKKGNDFGQLEHLKLKGHKVKQILVFCKNQSVLRGSYYGIKHNSKDTEHLNNGIENHSNGIEPHRNGGTFTTAAVNTTKAARTTAAVNATAAARTTAAVHEIASKSRCYRGPATKLSKWTILFCTSRELPYHV